MGGDGVAGLSLCLVFQLRFLSRFFPLGSLGMLVLSLVQGACRLEFIEGLAPWFFGTFREQKLRQ